VTPAIERALRLWADGIVHRQDHPGDRAVDLLRQAVLHDPGDAEVATVLASLLMRRASAWAEGAWSGSHEWIDHYPYDDGRDGEDLGEDDLQPWRDIIADRDEAERLLTGALAATPADGRAALLSAMLWLDRWVTNRMLYQELPDEADLQATGRALLDAAPAVIRRAEELSRPHHVHSIIRAEAARFGAPDLGEPSTLSTGSRWSWYVLRRGHVWNNNGDLATAFLVTAEWNEILWAYGAWTRMELPEGAPFVLEVYRAGDRVRTVDLSAEPLPGPGPVSAGEPLPFGFPAIAYVNDVPCIVHHGYSFDAS
jgi:hypothetical protein